MLTHMKTTVELPDELLREAQQLARDEGTTMKSLLEEGLRAVIARHRETAPFELRDASVAGEGLTPEFASATWAQIREASYGGRG
jgi:predicted transcriptional regulator